MSFLVSWNNSVLQSDLHCNCSFGQKIEGIYCHTINGAKVKAASTRPFLEEELKIAMCAWLEVNTWLFSRPKLPVASLEAKFFYATTK